MRGPGRWEDLGLAGPDDLGPRFAPRRCLAGRSGRHAQQGPNLTLLLVREVIEVRGQHAFDAPVRLGDRGPDQRLIRILG